MNKTKIIPTASQLDSYEIMKRSGNIKRNTNIRFGRIIVSTDADKDG